MKLIHLSDLHIGKKVNEYSLYEDQKNILEKIVEIVIEEKPEAVFIAGDIYDKSVPSAEAVQLFDTFLTKLSETGKEIFIISGNHDSAERISFGAEIMKNSGIHLSQVYNGDILPTTLEDEFGRVNIYMLPFIKPFDVRYYLEIEETLSYTEALSLVIDKMKINTLERNVLISHQYITGAKSCDSEDVIGGIDNVDAGIFSDFDYVALGHLHRPQSINEKIRYCGSPLKYSISEVKDQKSVSIVDLREKGNIILNTRPLKPVRDWHDLRGLYSELIKGENYTKDFVRITLNDENEILNAFANLRNVYPNIISFAYDNERTKVEGINENIEKIKEKTPMQLFSEFYKKQNGSEINSKQEEYVQNLINEIWGKEQ